MKEVRSARDQGLRSKKMSRSGLVIGVLMALSVAVTPIYAFAEEYSLDDLYRIVLQRSEKIKVSEETGKQVFLGPPL